MALRVVYEKYKKVYLPYLLAVNKKVKENLEIFIALGILFASFLLIFLPKWQVSGYGISDAKTNAELVNQYRLTLAQIIGGIAILLGLYFTWGNLKVSQEGQITERFTKAIDQLGASDQSGNPKLETRLGGIYALERISWESDKDYWPIMEILTAYVRKNSSVDSHSNENTKGEASEKEKIPLDIQAILTVIGRRNYLKKHKEMYNLYLEKSDLRGAHLINADLKNAWLEKASLERADLRWAHLEGAYLKEANLKNADLQEAHLEGAVLREAHLEGADLKWANLNWADLLGANLEGTDFLGAHFKGAYLKRAQFGVVLGKDDLERDMSLTIAQLSKVKTLYNAIIDDEELLRRLKREYPALFEET